MLHKVLIDKKQIKTFWAYGHPLEKKFLNKLQFSSVAMAQYFALKLFYANVIHWEIFSCKWEKVSSPFFSCVKQHTFDKL